MSEQAYFLALARLESVCATLSGTRIVVYCNLRFKPYRLSSSWLFQSLYRPARRVPEAVSMACPSDFSSSPAIDR